MTSTVEETIFITQDTYISSDAPDKNEDSFPLLNVGRSENGKKNRVLLKADFNFQGKRVTEAELCLFQIYTGIHAKESDVLYLHEVNREWNEGQATWNNLGSSPIGNLVSAASFSTTEDMKVCFQMDPSRVSNNRFGYILKGEEDLDKHDRWFRSSEYESSSKDIITPASSDLYHPHFQVKTVVDPNALEGIYGTRSKGNSQNFSWALVIALTVGSLALVLVAFMAIKAVRRRYMYEEEESSSESEVEERDFVDNLGEVFGVVSSSDEEETFNTRDTTIYDSHDGIEVQNYHRQSVGQRFQNALFGVPEEETTITDDSSYISRWYRNNRR